MEKIILKADKRTVQGRKVKQLRSQGIVPANIFGKNVKSEAISITLEDFENVFEKAGETSLITLSLEGSDHSVLISNVQMDPITDTPLHVDFRQVSLKEKITAMVPVEVVGEAPAEKEGVGTVVHYINEVEVEALPTDLPEKFVVDVSNLSEVDQAIHLKDIKVDEKVEVLTDPETIIAKVEAPQKEEEPVVETPAEGEVVEGATPAEGAEAPAEESTPAAE